MNEGNIVSEGQLDVEEVQCTNLATSGTALFSDIINNNSFFFYSFFFFFLTSRKYGYYRKCHQCDWLQCLQFRIY